jgi:hypothetical protein
MIVATIEGAADWRVKINKVVRVEFGDWYVFCVQDCAFPPFALVRADSFESAYYEFIDGCTDWIRIDDDCLGDYDAETLQYAEDFSPVDTEAVMGWPAAAVDFFHPFTYSDCLN